MVKAGQSRGSSGQDGPAPSPARQDPTPLLQLRQDRRKLEGEFLHS